MNHFLTRVRLVAGASLIGAVVGVVPGAVVGLVYGCWVANPGLGLDGALVTAAVFALLGAGYGLAVAAGPDGAEAPRATQDSEIPDGSGKT